MLVNVWCVVAFSLQGHVLYYYLPLDVLVAFTTMFVMAKKDRLEDAERKVQFDKSVENVEMLTHKPPTKNVRN